MRRSLAKDRQLMGTASPSKIKIMNENKKVKFEEFEIPDDAVDDAPPFVTDVPDDRFRFHFEKNADGSLRTVVDNDPNKNSN